MRASSQPTLLLHSSLPGFGGDPYNLWIPVLSDEPWIVRKRKPQLKSRLSGLLWHLNQFFISRDILLQELTLGIIFSFLWNAFDVIRLVVS